MNVPILWHVVQLQKEGTMDLKDVSVGKGAAQA